MRDLFKKYPSIVPDLQNNDKILDMLLDKHPELCLKEYPPELIERFREAVKDAKEALYFENYLKSFVEGIEPGKNEFKKYLKISPDFFEICLLNEPEYITQKVSFMYYGFANEYVFDEESLNFIRGIKVPDFRARNVLFKFCVIKEAL